jgi:hypothetical protein
MTQNYYTFIFFILTGLFPFLCEAQSSEPLPAEAPYQVTKISGEITFDGVPDEAAWEHIDALPLVMYRPVFGKTPTEKSIINIRFRYNQRDGNDFYLVYDERLQTNRSRQTPTLPFTASRTVLLKYTYTFRW